MTQTYRYSIPYNLETAVARLRELKSFQPPLALAKCQLKIDVLPLSENSYTFSAEGKPQTGAISSPVHLSGTIGIASDNSSYIQFDSYNTTESSPKFNAKTVSIIGATALVYILVSPNMEQAISTIMCVPFVVGWLWFITRFTITSSEKALEKALIEHFKGAEKIEPRKIKA